MPESEQTAMLTEDVPNKKGRECPGPYFARLDYKRV